MQNTRIQKNKGAAMMILVIFLLFIGITVITGVVSPVVREFAVAKDAYDSKQTYFLTESGVEDAYYRIKNNKQIGGSETLVLGTTDVTTTITDITGGQKMIESLGDTNSHQRTISLTVNAGEGVSFNYGMQSGTGGITMSNTSKVIGNVYSNGPINGSNSAAITGTAISANSESVVADQSYGSGTPASNNSFGNANSTQDIAQSFQIPATKNIIKAQLYIKKSGSPSNATVTIRTNNSGSPSSTIVASGTLSSSLVASSYGWVDITFSTNPSLTASTTYWLTVDVSSSSSSNYYIVGGDTGYSSGTAKTGSTSTPSWSQVGSSTDLFFQIFTGGTLGSISGMTVGTSGVGNAQANTVTGSTIAGSLYCQTGSSNNKSCDTSQADPVYQNFPVSSANITEWKDTAVAGGTTSSSISLSGSQTQSVGPRKISGNITLSNNSVLTLTGVVWVTGNLSISNSGILKLDSTYGSSSGMIIVDGTISTANSAQFQGSGTTGSFIMAISTSTSSSAINISNSAGSVVLVAPDGGIQLSNSAGAKELTAKSITLSNSATITYDSGLANANFTTGPSGSYSVSSWKETE